MGKGSAEIKENVETPQWRRTLNVIGLATGLLVLGGLLMGLIVVVAHFLERTQSMPEVAPPKQDNARTRVPEAYAPERWPQSPSRRSSAKAGGGGAASESSGAPAPASNVGVPVEDYQARVAAGEKVYLPNPKGECGLNGPAGAESIRALEACFAAQAAR